MNSALRPDRFRISFGYIPDGLYALFNDGHIKSTLLPRILIKEFHSQNSVLITRAVLAETIWECHFPYEAKNFVDDGDIVSISKGTLRVLLTRRSSSNTLLVTERCDNLCKFCSQPPKEQNDDALLGLAANALIDFNFDGLIGISGGEPFLYGQKFLNFLSLLDEFAINTTLHVLTNGRAFSNLEFSRKFANAILTRKLTLGIPLYSTESSLHDLLVGANGAWADTIYGLINLMHLGVGIELRFIPTKLNIEQLRYVVPFVAKCLPSITQISIMNMEPKGWARKNWSELFISPLLYKDLLTDACSQALQYGIKVFLFNYPLCHINPSDYSFAVKSISDWKNFYPEECGHCAKAIGCCGFFSSADGSFLDKPRRIE